MSICEDAPASAVAGKGSFVPKIGLATWAGRIGQLLSTWRNRRIAVNMRDFDDAQLADIGLTRADVERALGTPGIDPTLHLMSVRQNPLRGLRHR